MPNVETEQKYLRAEQVKDGFDLDQFLSGQKRAWQLLEELKTQIQPGMTEAQAHQIYSALQEKSGAQKYWHPAKIRFGVNTLHSFSEPSNPDVVLQANDIFFVDIGPIYNGYEGDVGRTFQVGEWPQAKRVIESCELIFHKVAEKFKTQQLKGAELYVYAESLAREQGYELVGDGAQGHRIGDFPHAIHYRGSLKGFDRTPSPHRWILEIQLRDHASQIGAFYEDLLN
jgi:Xaa-Pro aminopeptidase